MSKEEMLVLQPTTEINAVVNIPELVEQWKGNVPEVNLEDEDVKLKYAVAKKGHLLFVGARNKVEKARKTLKDPALQYGKEVDSKAKDLKALLAPLEDQLFIQRKKYEDYLDKVKQDEINAEQERVRLINVEIEKLRMMPSNFIGSTSEVLTNVYSKVEVPSEELFQERLEEAIEVYKDSMNKMETMIAQAKGAEEAEATRAEQTKADAASKAEEQKVLDAERAELAKEREEIEAFKRDQAKRQQAEQEAQDLANAEAEAALVARDNEELIHNNKAETLENLRDIIKYFEINTADMPEAILESIIAGKVRGVFYEQI